MSKHLERDLGHLHAELLEMGAAVEEAIVKAVAALRERDVRLARQVISGDERIDTQENQLHEDCLKILALHQPVATDLRRVTAAFMIDTDLERMADLAVGIAERAVDLAGRPPVPKPPALQEMADLTLSMLRQALLAYVEMDSTRAQRVIRLDKQVDLRNDAIIAEIVQAMQRTPEQAEALLSVFTATRHLERIADHATNIAEGVLYLIEGKLVRHRLIAQDADEDEDSGAFAEADRE